MGKINTDKNKLVVDNKIKNGKTIQTKYDYLPSHKISEREYKKLKIRLQELEKKRKNKLLYAIVVLFFVIMTVSTFFLDTPIRSIEMHEIIFYAFLGIIIGCIICLYIHLIFEMQESSLSRKINEYEVDNIQGEVKDDIFENSIKMSYKYLDQYYLQTREQAQRGFFVTVCIVVGGAILIGVGITAMFLEKTTPSVITCTSGIIIEFIAAVFFYLYNKTVTSMSSYHNKLVLSQNISIALKVSDSLSEEEQIKTKSLIISELIKNINGYLTEEETIKGKK